MNMIKKKTVFLFTLILALFAGCEVDYNDINTLGKVDPGSNEITMNLDLFVSGNWTPNQVLASEEEIKVEKYDLLIFKVSSEGNYLEYKETDVVPASSEVRASDNNVKIGSKTIVLPTGGTKRIIAIANRGDKTGYPELRSVAESKEADLSDVTVYDDFINQFSVNAQTLHDSPFVMVGNSLVSDANATNAFVVLAPQYTKINVNNKSIGTDGDNLFVSSIQLLNVPKAAFPLINNFTKKVPEFTNYASYQITDGSAAALVSDKFYVLYTPGTNTLNLDYRVAVLVKGKNNGIDFEKTFYCSNPMYPGYQYSMNLSLSNGEVMADFVPNWSDGNFSISGVNLKNNTMTFPFTADKYWGYEISWSTDIVGDVVVEKEGNEPWYSVAVDDNIVRVCCLEDNYSAERSASFSISLGKKKETVRITQQTMPQSTITFNNMEWMDRNIGAILPANEANITNADAYGYYYQWGRNIPFPTFGDVDVVDIDAGRTVQDAHGMKEFIAGGSGVAYDWWNNGTQINDKTTTWTDRTGSLGDPCPEGFHVPSYTEYQTILPYKNSAGIGNFANVKSVLNAGEVLDETGVEYNGLYVTSDAQAATIYVIKKYKTNDAYYLRLRRIESAGSVYLRIDRLPGNAESDFAGADDAAKLNAAAAVFASVGTGMETIYFPASGRRDRITGIPTNQGKALYGWASTCWTTSSSSIYFDPVDSNTRIYNMGNNRAHAQTVRCVKNR